VGGIISPKRWSCGAMSFCQNAAHPIRSKRHSQRKAASGLTMDETLPGKAPQRVRRVHQIAGGLVTKALAACEPSAAMCGVARRKKSACCSHRSSSSGPPIVV
jgi:hypothetical protein